MGTNLLTETMCDHEVVFMMPPTEVNALLEHLERIDRQAQHAVTGSEPVNPQAVFIRIDEIKKALARADRSGRFAWLSSQHDRHHAREAAARLA